MKEIRYLTEDNIDEILALQKEIFSNEKLDTTVRLNSRENLIKALNNGKSLGLYNHNKLIAFTIFCNIELEKEIMQKINIITENTGYYKICLVHKDYRGNGYQKLLFKLLENSTNYNQIITTVHPNNKVSLDNIKSLGFKFYGNYQLHGSDRIVLILDE